MAYIHNIIIITCWTVQLWIDPFSAGTDFRRQILTSEVEGCNLYGSACDLIWPLIPHWNNWKIILVIDPEHRYLKGLAQAKIIKKSVILFWLLYMTIWCEHVHRLELQKFFIFFATHLPVRLAIETKFLIFNFGQPCQKLEIRKFRLYI